MYLIRKPAQSSVRFSFNSAKRFYSDVKITPEVRKVKPRWFYATDIPNTKPFGIEYQLKKRPTKFLPFTSSDSDRIEEAFIKFQAKLPESRRFVNVHEDGMFSVDLMNRILKPAYWEGLTYEVRRGVWFLDDNLPLPDLLSEQIEEYYAKYRPDYFLGKDMENRKHSLPGIKLKSEKELYTLYSKKYLGGPRKWPYKEFDDLSEVPKTLHFKSENEALLINEGKLLPDMIVESFKGYSSIFGMYSIKRGYEKKKNLADENTNKKSETPSNSAISHKIEKIGEELELDELSSDINVKLQQIIEKDYSNETVKIENSKDREIDHLVLCVHGIGQSLSSKSTSINFAHDCNHLRKLLKEEFIKKSSYFVPLAYGREAGKDEKLKNCKVQVLPIIWRYDIDFGLDKLYEEFDSNGDYRLPRLSDININSVTPLRNIAADVVLDVLLFYEPKFHAKILESVIKSANKIYDKYLENHPNFKGKVSILGHSLGSAITLDILSQQPDTIPRGKDFNPQKHLKFDVENFFAIGSPNGVFKFIKRENIHPRRMRENRSGNAPEAGVVYPKVENLYNIFYATDLVAYRIEPIIHSSMNRVKPKKYHSLPEDNMITNKLKDISKASTGLLSNSVVKKIVSNTTGWKDLKVPDPTEAFKEIETSVHASEHVKELMFGLNKNGRVDYMLPQSMFDIDMISAIGSHVQYFEDADVADFLLSELWKKPPATRKKDLIGVLADQQEEDEHPKSESQAGQGERH